MNPLNEQQYMMLLGTQLGNFSKGPPKSNAERISFIISYFEKHHLEASNEAQTSILDKTIALISLTAEGDKSLIKAATEKLTQLAKNHLQSSLTQPVLPPLLPPSPQPVLLVKQATMTPEPLKIDQKPVYKEAFHWNILGKNHIVDKSTFRDFEGSYIDDSSSGTDLAPVSLTSLFKAHDRLIPSVKIEQTKHQKLKLFLYDTLMALPITSILALTIGLSFVFAPIVVITVGFFSLIAAGMSQYVILMDLPWKYKNRENYIESLYPERTSLAYTEKKILEGIKKNILFFQSKNLEEKAKKWVEKIEEDGKKIEKKIETITEDLKKLELNSKEALELQKKKEALQKEIALKERTLQEIKLWPEAKKFWEGFYQEYFIKAGDDFLNSTDWASSKNKIFNLATEYKIENDKYQKKIAELESLKNPPEETIRELKNKRDHIYNSYSQVIKLHQLMVNRQFAELKAFYIHEDQYLNGEDVKQLKMLQTKIIDVP